MTVEGDMRTLAGLAAAWHRGDSDGVRALRPMIDADSRAFFTMAFGTILLFTDRVAQLLDEPPKSVLKHVRDQAPGTMTATVAGVAIASLAEDADTFNALGEEATKSAEFIPSIFHVLVWLAEQIAFATRSTADAVLADYALTAAAAEAGMLDGE